MLRSSYKNFSWLLTLLCATSILTTSASGTKSACLGQPLTINYSSSNSTSCSTITTPPGYASFTPTANTSGSYNPGNANNNSGDFTLICTNGATIISDVTTLTVNTAEAWNGSACVTPSVVSAVITGQYYPPGTLNFTCNNSNTYTIRRDGALFIATTTYSGPVTITPISLAGNYVIQCNQGSLTSQVARAYSIIPNDAATVKLSVTPKNIVSGSNVTVKWDTTYPLNTCTLAARVVCANNACSAAQTAVQNALNAILTSTTTDFNDPNTSRSITTAIRIPAPGHKDSDPVITTLDWKALGKKTLRITNTTDLTYDCGGTSKETKRIQVTKSSEQ